MIPQRWGRSIKDTKTYPGAECGSDHRLLVTELKLKLKTQTHTLKNKNRWHLGNNENYSRDIEKGLSTLKTKEIEQMNENDQWTNRV